MGGVLKNVLLTGASGFKIFGIRSSWDRTLVKNINGRTLGKTLNAHAEIPSRDFSINLDGFEIMQIRKNIIIKAKNACTKVCPDFFEV